MTSAPPPVPPASPSLDPPVWAPPPPPPGFPPRPQLRRSRSDKILGGVSGGLAEYSGIDALLWRVGFVALALAGGTGVIVYLLLWLLMPADPIGAPGAARRPAGRRMVQPRSPVPGLTVAGLLIVVGAMALLDRFTWVSIGATGFLGAALLVVATGLIVAAFTGGRTARGGLIALGVVLSVALTAASTVDWRGSSEDVGDRVYRPTTVAEVRDVYRGGLGDFTLDLTLLDISDLENPVSAEVQHDIGDVRVILPRDADVQVRAEVDLGSLDVLESGSVDKGFFPGDGPGAWVDDGAAEFDLVIRNGLGDVEVSRG
ncbi:MAG: PspC protein [Blastococcus sp.]|jgi:phage shock protein PspC (stress-responsive transcriptional regulator)|nr:PspC protein [Blastococcus sp.]